MRKGTGLGFGEDSPLLQNKERIFAVSIFWGRLGQRTTPKGSDLFCKGDTKLVGSSTRGTRGGVKRLGFEIGI